MQGHSFLGVLQEAIAGPRKSHATRPRKTLQHMQPCSMLLTPCPCHDWTRNRSGTPWRSPHTWAPSSTLETTETGVRALSMAPPTGDPQTPRRMARSRRTSPARRRLRDRARGLPPQPPAPPAASRAAATRGRWHGGHAPPARRPVLRACEAQPRVLVCPAQVSQETCRAVVAFGAVPRTMWHPPWRACKGQCRVQG